VNTTTDDELRESGYALARALTKDWGGNPCRAADTRNARRLPTPTAGAPATALAEAVDVGGGRNVRIEGSHMAATNVSLATIRKSSAAI
jgi:hypothetical protein